MTIDNDRAVWTCRRVAEAEFARACEPFEGGLSVRDVAQELEISRSEAGR